MKTAEFLGGRVIVKVGDITNEKCDAIVNAANSSLMGGGGVDGAIHRAGGSKILEECRKIRYETLPNGLPDGEAVITSAGNLPSKFVIHTVGPVWHGGHSGENLKLAGCYENSLNICFEKEFSSVAFPAISTGVFGYPPDKAAKVSSEAVKEFLQNHEFPKTVIFIFFKESDLQTFLDNSVFS